MNLIKKIVLFSCILSMNYLDAMAGKHLEFKPVETKQDPLFYENKPKTSETFNKIKENAVKQKQQQEQANLESKYKQEKANKQMEKYSDKQNVPLYEKNTPQKEIQIKEQKNSTTQKPNTINNFSTQKMQAPLETYVEKINTALEKTYPITKALPAKLIRLYTIGYLQDRSNSLWSSTITLSEINEKSIPTDRDWDKQNPSTLEKFSAGLDALQKSSDTKIEALKKYQSKFQDASMSDPMEYYVKELQKNPLFKDQSPIVLQHYILEVLKETNSGQSHWLFGTYDTLIPSEVAEYKPEWPKEINSEGDLIRTPTPSQKIYAMMEAIDTITKKSKEINTPQKSTVISRLSDASNWVKEIQTNIFTQAEKTLLNTLFTPEEIDKIEKQSEQAQEENKDPEIIKDYLEKNKAVLPYEKTGSLIKDLFDRQTRSPLTLYFIDTFQETAKKIGQSQEKLKTFVSSIIQTFSTIKGLSKAETAMLQTEGNNEVNNLVDNQNSWFNAKTSEFNEKFSAWIEIFVAKMYEKVGKTNQKNIQSITFIEEQHNPLTPKIDINWNTQTHKIASILVTYKDNALVFTGSHIIFDPVTGIYTVETYLYPKPQSKTLTESISHAVSDTLTNAVVMSPLHNTAQGNPLLVNDVNKVEKNLISQPFNSEGILTLTYNPAKNILETVIMKQNRQNAQISTTTKTYATDTQKLQSQITKISPKTDIQTNLFFSGSADTYTPDITVAYNPHSQEEPVNFTIQYQHPQSGEIFTYSSTPQEMSFKDGTYTIQASLKPLTQKVLPAGVTGQIITLWEKISPALTTKAYRATVSGFKKSWTGARLHQQFPESYNAAERWMLANYQTGVDSVIIEFNPAENIIATRVLNTTAEGKIEGKNSVYLIN